MRLSGVREAVRLTELEPQFIRYELENGRESLPYVSALAEAQGVLFLCPACFKANNGPVGTHMVLCWFRDRGVPDTATPKPGRWSVNGTSCEDLTLAPSVLLNGDGCGWHGFVTAGAITTC